MPAEPLTAPEREEIRVGIERGDPDAGIARRLGRHRCTIGREIARNGGRSDYTATAAQERADSQRCRPKDARFVKDPVLAAHVTARLEAKDSPMTISIELRRGTHGLTANVSHECVYQGIYAQGTRGLRKGLHAGLHRKRRVRKHRRGPGEALPDKASPLGEFNLIHVRPPEAADRSEVGHLEGDLIIGAFNRSAIATIFDRASRHLWLADFPASHDADETLAAVGEIISVSLNRCAGPSPGTKAERWPATKTSPRPTASTCSSPSRTPRGNAPPTRTATAPAPLLPQEHQPRHSQHRRPPTRRAPHQHHPPTLTQLGHRSRPLPCRRRDDRLNSPWS